MKTAIALNSVPSAVDTNRRNALFALPGLLFTGSLVTAPSARAQPSFDVAAIEQAAADADLHGVLVWRAGRDAVSGFGEQACSILRLRHSAEQMRVRVARRRIDEALEQGRRRAELGQRSRTSTGQRYSSAHAVDARLDIARALRCE